MPELPEVEAVTRKLSPAAGARIVSVGRYRKTITNGAERAVGRRIAGFERRGKHIIVRLEGGDFLRVHLKMTGDFLMIPDWRLRPETARAWFALDNGAGLALDDPRALGRIRFHRRNEEDAVFADLGPEPFSPEFTLDHLAREAAKCSRAVKLFLMDQKAVVGLGNIYAAEALFQARIHPSRPACSIRQARLERLYRAIIEVLRAALDSAVAAYERPGSTAEGESFPVAVYGREGERCFSCGARIRRIAQGGRSTYYCPRCQR